VSVVDDGRQRNELAWLTLQDGSEEEPPTWSTATPGLLPAGGWRI